MVALKVILDSCVLYPMYLRDTLLCAAEAGFYQVYWSQEILEGAFRNLVADGRLKLEQASYLEKSMKLAFPEATVKVTDRLIPCLDNHPGDRHVLAAGLIAKADLIVTDNLKHFPQFILAEYNIEAKNADNFLTDLFDVSPEKMLEVLQTQVQGKKKPRLSVLQLLELLQNQTPNFSRRVQQII